METHGATTFYIENSIGILTLGMRPENYLPAPEFIPVDQFIRWTGAPGLKGLVIHGAGRNFSAGGDLDKIFSATEGEGELEGLLEAGHRLFNTIRELDIPVIAAINRVCFGGGLELAMACHFRVASENAHLAFPEVNTNLMPGMGGTFMLPRAVGTFEAMRMVLGGDMLSAADALSAGLVDFIAPKDQAFEFAISLLNKMTADRPVKVVRHIMKALRNASVLDPVSAMREETRLFCELARDEAERRRLADES